MMNGDLKHAPLVLPLLFVLLAGCAGPPPPKPEAPAPELAQEAYSIDFSGLYEHAFSESFYDPGVIRPGLMERVLVEQTLLSQGGEAELWAVLRLMSWLRGHGSLIIGPPLPPALETRAPCQTGGCFDTPPTAVLRAVRFVSGVDQVEVAVTRGEADLLVSIRSVVEGKSLCPDDFKLTLGHVQLSLMVQRMSDGAIAGLLQETRLLAKPAKPTIEASLPIHERSPDAFCRALASLFENTPALVNTDWQYMVGAQALLDTVLPPLYPKGEQAQ